MFACPAGGSPPVGVRVRVCVQCCSVYVYVGVCVPPTDCLLLAQERECGKGKAAQGARCVCGWVKAIQSRACKAVRKCGVRNLHRGYIFRPSGSKCRQQWSFTIPNWLVYQACLPGQ